jgi:hypothetical protein
MEASEIGESTCYHAGAHRVKIVLHTAINRVVIRSSDECKNA